MKRTINEGQPDRGMTRKTYFVSPLQGGWKVTKEGGLVLGTYPTEDGAIQAARIVARSNQPSEVMVQFKDGIFRTAWTFDETPAQRRSPVEKGEGVTVTGPAADRL
jgi:hypothetical protein